MTININFKELWDKQPASAPDTKELFEKANKYKRKNLRELVITNVLLLVTSAFIIFVWYFYKPEMVTTKTGVILCVLAMVSYLLVYNQMIPLLLKTDYFLNSSDYLHKLLKIKEKQLFLQSTMLNIYFILLITGISLYMYEYALRMSLFWGLFTYAMTFTWFAITWFIFRKNKIKKQRAAVNDLIRRFSEISDQLKAE